MDEDRFLHVRTLGSGSLARVDLVRDRRDGTLFARKRVSLADEERLGVLRREYRIRSRLGHPQVPDVHELGFDEEGATLLLDYVEGEDLVAALRALGPAALPGLLAQALNAVAWLHRRDVIHGDLKPENLCVQGTRAGGQPLVRVLDFGTALDRAHGDREWLGGTPAFLAPYLKETGRPEPKTDLYALGRSFQRALAEARTTESAPERALVDPVLARLAHSDPHLTYASAEHALDELLERVPAVRRADLPRPKEAPFHGREAERAALAARLQALETGLLRENLMLVCGAEGLGKTRLLRELERQAVLAGLRVIRLRCPRPCAPLEPVLELVARLLPKDHPDQERLAQALAPVSPGADEPGRGLTQRLVRDLARTIKSVGARLPLVVLIDDLEHADEPTLDFLRILARLGAPSGPFVVAALGTDRESPAKSLLEAGENVGALHLDPLPSAVLRDLIASVLPRGVDEGSPLDDWITLSQGSPALATALALSYGAEGTSATRSREELLQDVMARRLGQLTAGQREILRALAIFERATPFPLLSRLCTGSDDELQAGLERLIAVGLVEAEARRSGRRFRLTSTSVGEHLLAELSRSDKIHLHARALTAWSSWPFPVERPPDVLARHALGAGKTGEAIELGRAGVVRLLAQGSLRAAEELIDAIRPLVPESEPGARFDLQCALADACLRTGRPSDARRAVEAVGDPLRAESGWPSEDRVRALRLLGAAAEAEGELGVALEMLQVGYELASEETPAHERQRLSERLGAVHFRQGDYVAARGVWNEGLAITGGDDQGLARSELLNDLGVLDCRQGHLETAEGRHRAAMEIRRGLGDLDGESRSLTNLANVHLRRGELRAAAENYEESLRLKRLVGTLPAQAVTLRSLGTLYRNHGEFGKAIACLQESVELRVRIRDRIGEAATRRILAVLLIEKGEVRAAAEELDLCRRALEQGDTSGPERAALREAEARFALEQGRWSQATALASEGIEELGPSPDSSLHSGLLRLCGRARLAAGRADQGIVDLEAAYAEACRAEDLWEIGWNHLELGRARWARGAQGEAARARAELEAAEELARRMQASHLLAETLLSRFDVEFEAGDPDEAIGLLVEAERLAARIGVPATQLGAWHRMGLHALRCGFVSRAVQWWRKGIEVLRDVVTQYEEELRSRFLEKPEHRALVVELEVLLADRGDLAQGRDPTASLNDLLVQSEGFAPGVAGEPGRAALRPEILTRLLEISRAMSGLHHREEIMAYLGKRLEELFDAENSRIILIRRDGSLHMMGESAEASEPEYSRTLVDRVLADRQPILVQDTSHDPELSDKSSVHRLGLTSVLCAPLIVDDEVIGVIQFDHRSKPGPFTEEDLSVLQLFSHQAATTLKNMLLVEQLDESIDRIQASEAKLVAGERLRALGEMSAGVAHDFNNLLTIIVGITDLMRTNENLPEDLKHDVETLETVSETAAATVRRLQEFRGVPTTGEATTRIDAIKVVRQAVELGRRRFVGNWRHEMRLEFEELPAILGHEAELREVLLNLIINAIEAMPDGGGVTVRTGEEEGYAVLEVEDEGVGIDPELGQRIFEPFFTTKSTGQGMGLSICWGIVRRMGGTIQARPAAGKGTVFRLRLPAAPPQADDPVPSLAEQGRSLAAHVLVVDDDPVVREVICRMLATAGFHPVGSGDGREALQLFARETFDLVLTDYAMPEMDGAEVAREIKRMRADCPVVLLTGRSPTSAEVGDHENPFSTVLRKPITTEKLAAALHLSRN